VIAKESIRVCVYMGGGVGGKEKKNLLFTDTANRRKQHKRFNQKVTVEKKSKGVRSN